MNPYLILVVMLGFAGFGVGGFRLGVDHEKASEKDKAETVAAAIEAANQASADAISKIKVKNSTIYNEIQRETHEKLIYSECRHSPDGVRLVNQALDPSALRIGGGKLPSADAPK